MRYFIMSYRARLRKAFFKNNGSWKDLNGNPKIDYVKWLEDKLIAINVIQKIEEAENE